MTEKNCIACGMPMREPDDFAMKDLAKDYCIHCARPDGSMQSFEEKRESMASFIIKTQGFDRTAALKTAEDMMKKLPAWAGFSKAVI